MILLLVRLWVIPAKFRELTKLVLGLIAVIARKSVNLVNYMQCFSITLYVNIMMIDMMD